MRFGAILLAVAGLASAMPMKRDAVTDTQVFQVALTLEHLESAFYTKGLKLFDAAAFEAAGFPDFVRGRINQIAEHESTHVKTLEKKLGSAAPKACKYEFPLTDVKSFVALSSALEWGGASAYTGAIGLLNLPEDVTLAASILATEARQAAWVNSAVLHSIPWDGSFNTVLTADEVLGVVHGLIKSCPSTNPPLIASPFPRNVTVGAGMPGERVTVEVQPPLVQNNTQFYLALKTGLSTDVVPIHSGKAVLPKHLQGIVFAIVTNSINVSDDTTVAGTGVLSFPFPASAYNG
jgi:hypothetical protein